MILVADLPKRPEPPPDTHRIVDPKERVKSVADKVDPRFEAARSRADRQDAIRARQESGDEPGSDPVGADLNDDSDVVSGDVSASDGAKKGSFSFNLTADEPKDEQ